ncbi:unnamed protein product [Discosporangium mesarthrocarpum]
MRLIENLRMVFMSASKGVPPEILHTLLNLAEFMDLKVEALPIDIRILAILAQDCHAYAKALYYKELEYVQSNGTTGVEQLISINKKLGLSEAANGILTSAEKRAVKSGVKFIPKEAWLAKLGRWQAPLDSYWKLQEENHDDVAAVVGCMKCLDALGRWSDLVELAQSRWGIITEHGSDTKLHRKSATMAARATWCLGQWDLFENFVSHIEETVVDGAYFRAVLALRKNKLLECER